MRVEAPLLAPRRGLHETSGTVFYEETSGLTQNKASNNEGNNEEEHEEGSELPRKSVIDLWREREKSVIGKVKNGVGGMGYSEEKKEQTPHDEEHDRCGFVAKTKTTPSHSSPRYEKQSVAVSPSPPLSWKQGSAPRTPEVDWKTQQQVQTPVAMVTPEAPDRASPPAFHDLKSQWASFGAKKIQAREDSVVPSKRQSALGSPPTSPKKSVDTENSQVDEFIPGDPGTPPVTQKKRQSQSIDTLQQPVLEESGAPGRDSHPRRTKAGWSKAKPSPKVGTRMYVKDTKNGVMSKTPTSEVTKESPSRLGKFSQKKQFLERVRRRSKTGSGRPDVTTTPSTNSEDTINTILEPLQENFSDKALDIDAEHTRTDAARSEEQKICSKPTIPIETLMAYGADEDGFIRTALEPNVFKSDGGLDFNATRWGDEDPPLDRGAVDDNSSSVVAETYTSTIAARAAKALREKRQSNQKHEDDEERPSHALSPASFDDDEMMMLDKEQEELSGFHSASVSDQHAGGFRPVSPETHDDTYSQSAASNMVSTITGFSEMNTRNRPILPDAIITDEFVKESTSNVEAFQTTLKSSSLQQLASDLAEEAGTVLKGVDLKKISSGWNQGMAAASQSLSENVTAATSSLNELVGAGGRRKKLSVPQRKRGPSPVEEVAIEVEYVEDD